MTTTRSGPRPVRTILPMENSKFLEDYAAERRGRKERLEKLIPELQEELASLDPAPAPKWSGRLNKKERVDRERRLLGRVIKELEYGDVRELVAGLGIGWRRFTDRRHQALWRVLETVDTGTIDGRMDLLEGEMLEKARKEDAALKIPQFKGGDTNADGTHILKGLPGSAAAALFKKALIEGASDGLAWLERGLDAAGAFPLVGGKAYLRELAELELDSGFMTPKEMAESLFGGKA